MSKIIYFVFVIILTRSSLSTFPAADDLFDFLKTKIQASGFVLTELPNVLSLMGLLGQKQPFNSREKALICNSLENTASEATEPETYLYAHSSLRYMGCNQKDIHPGVGRMIVGKQQSPKSIYFVSRILSEQLSSENSKIFEKIELPSLNETMSATDKLFLALNLCSRKDKKLSDDSFLADIYMTLSSSQSSSDHEFEQSSLLMMAYIDCGKLDSMTNDQHLLIMDKLRKDFTFDLAKLNLLIPLLKKLKDLIVYPEFGSCGRFQTFENKKFIEVDAVDKFFGSSLTEKLQIGVNKLVCDSKIIPVKQALVKTEKNLFRIFVDTSYQECTFELKIDSPKSMRLLITHKNLTAISLRKLSLVDLSLSLSLISDPDSSKSHSVSFGDDVGKLVEEDIASLSLSFFITSNNARVHPHQVIMYMDHNMLDLKANFVCKTNVDRYTCEFDTYKDGNKSFFYTSGRYNLKLIVADSGAILTEWNMGVVGLSFSKESSFRTNYAGLKPELHNYPKELYKKPFKLTSLIFSALVLFTSSCLLVLWPKTGMGLSLRISVWRIIFYFSFAALLGLYFCYWWFMNGFEALRVIGPLVILVCLSLNYVLDTNTIV